MLSYLVFSDCFFQKITLKYKNMGSDLGHDNDKSKQLLSSKHWSKKEKEVLRLLLSNRVGTIILIVLLELMIYNYAVYTIYIQFYLVVSHLYTDTK